MSDTRRDKRAPVALKVRYKSATVDEFIEQYSEDISRGGTFIKSKKPMSVGTLLKFELQLKDESRLVHGVGRVVWTRDPEQATEGKPAGMGIKFIKMDPDSRALVQKVIDSRGERPGTFDSENGVEEGNGAATEEPSGPPFFPSSTPEGELPEPEDRTAVRHASEFLAEALADTEGAAATEARAGAEAARKRTEELERARGQGPPSEAAEGVGGAADEVEDRSTDPAPVSDD
ncbi:MAG: TIGR02266 family protein, partial [Myxococcota bacterium]